MKVKATLAVAALAASVGGLSACGSSTSKPAASAPSTAVSTAASGSVSPSSASPVSSASSSPATSPSADSSESSSAPTQTAPLKNVPAGALLSTSDLIATPRGKWASNGAEDPVAGKDIVDPDSCDPVPRPQNVDPAYPRNPAWTSMRSVGFASPDQMAQVMESVITYKSANAAAADFAKHRGWIASCTEHFQWTDMPAKNAVSTESLPQVSDAAVIRVAMYAPDQPASAAGSQGYVYQALILRGNALAVVRVSDTGPTTAKLHDPGLTTAQHDIEAAAAKLGAAFGGK